MKDNTYDYIIELLNFHKSLKQSLKVHKKNLSLTTLASIHEQMYTIKKTIRDNVESL